MYIGGSLFLMAVGAILRWAVSWQVSGFDVQLAGLIVFLVGILGLVLSLIFWFTRRSSRGPRRDGGALPQDYPPTAHPPLP